MRRFIFAAAWIVAITSRALGGPIFTTEFNTPSQVGPGGYFEVAFRDLPAAAPDVDANVEVWFYRTLNHWGGRMDFVVDDGIYYTGIAGLLNATPTIQHVPIYSNYLPAILSDGTMLLRFADREYDHWTIQRVVLTYEIPVVPEPSTLALGCIAFTALLGLAVAQARRKADDRTL